MGELNCDPFHGIVMSDEVSSLIVREFYTSSLSLSDDDLLEVVDESDWLAFLHNSSLEDTHGAKKRRIRPRRRPYSLPRVLKVDIRRKYPIMLINLANSCDPQLFMRFFSEFCVPDCQMHESILHPMTGERTEVFQRLGLVQILQLNCAKANAVGPDFVLQLQHACIKQSNMYAGSKLELRVTAKSSSFCLSKFFAGFGGTPEQFELMQSLLHTLEVASHCKVESLGAAGFNATMRITLDPHHRFQRLDMEMDFSLLPGR